MDLAKIVSVLLPSEVRESVLGDLAERGYRLSDILNVLPRIWFSSFRRAIALPSVIGLSDDAAFELRYHQFSRESGRAMLLIYLLWASIMTYVDQTILYLLIVLVGMAAWGFFGSRLRSFFNIHPGPRSWRELHIGRLRGQRARAGIWFSMVCIDLFLRTIAVRNGRTWPITAPHVELNLPHLSLNFSISTLLLFALNLLWAYRIHREIRQITTPRS